MEKFQGLKAKNFSPSFSLKKTVIVVNYQRLDPTEATRKAPGFVVFRPLLDVGVGPRSKHQGLKWRTKKNPDSIP
jgi:hypothetical protein